MCATARAKSVIANAVAVNNIVPGIATAHCSHPAFYITLHCVDTQRAMTRLSARDSSSPGFIGLGTQSSDPQAPAAKRSAEPRTFHYWVSRVQFNHRV